MPRSPSRGVMGVPLRPANVVSCRRPPHLIVLREPHLVIMDEPTNHLDLPAIESLETAPSETPCALLLVSHDRTFLSRLCTIEWRLEPEGRDAHLAVETMKAPTTSTPL